MRYTLFTISNFKGIQELTLDLDTNSASKVSILVGLNESGKTTIMEALSFFQENLKNTQEEYLTLHPSGINDIHSLIPKNQIDNFSSATKISAFFELDSSDIDELKQVLSNNGFRCTSVEPRMELTFEFNFENSVFKKQQTYWDANIYGKVGKKRSLQKLSSEDDAAWTHSCNFIRKHIPSIIYYPNFLFEFPDSIYLEKFAEQGREQAFYRLLIQDILDSLNRDLNLKTHVIERAKDRTSQNKEALNSVLSKMGNKITSLVFSENLSVFRTDTSNKSITVSYPEIDAKNNILYIELQLKDGEDIYYIRERSLGFKWFFTFLLFTQFRVHRSLPNANLVFLFDEPASNLHQTAQQRLLIALEKLTQSKVSVIYSTHSHHLINPKWLESTFIVRNKALEYKENDIDNFEPTNIKVEKYRTFVNQHPDQHTYYQPILDLLDYRPSNLEAIEDVIMVEGKNDLYTLSYFQDIILKANKKFPFLPGTGSGSLSTLR